MDVYYVSKKQLKPYLLNIPYSNLPLLYTSSFFLPLGLFTIYKGHLLPGLGMILVWLTSIWNHGTNTKIAKKIDIYSNYILGFIFTSYAIYLQHYVILGFSLLSILGHFMSKKYKKNWIHAICVHLPVVCGFYQYALI